MKRILVTAGGTATAWHVCQIVEKYFKNEIELFLCDTNEPYLVPSSIIAKYVYKVPPVVDLKYVSSIAKIIDTHHIDGIIPLIPQEAYVFAEDSEFCSVHKIKSSAPILKTTNLLADKLNMFNTLTKIGIPTPKVYKSNEINLNSQYILKPRLGFGSTGIKIISGDKLIREKISDNCVIQEYCHDDDYDEVTVEVYKNSVGFHIFSRRRISTKAGVCVKMEPVDADMFTTYVEKLIDSVKCPSAFNIQFLRHQGQWKLFDCNLRLGAGTALSTAIGFQLTRALLAELVGIEVEEKWFEVDMTARAVLRVYQEIVV